MTELSNREKRNVLSSDYAGFLHKYQQDHRLLLDALRDESVSMEEFERLSTLLHDDINELKHIKQELRRQRNNIDAETHPV